MARYKVVFRASSDNPDPERLTKWEPGCPLAFEAIQVSRNVGTGQAFLQGRLKNVSAKEVPSFKAVFTCTFSDGSTADFASHPLDADIPPWMDYTISPIELPRGDVLGASGTVAQAGAWASTGSLLISARERPLVLSEEAMQERLLQLGESGCEKAEDSAPYGIAGGGGWALCSCGQMSVGYDACPVCRTPFSLGKELENEQYLLLLATNRAEERARRDQEEARRSEELARLEREAEERAQEETIRKQARTKKTVKTIGAIITAVFAIALAATALKFAFVDFPEQTRRAEASDAVMELKNSGPESASQIQGVIDEHYASMTEEDKQYCLKLLGLNLCGNRAWSSFAPPNALEGSFEGHFDVDGDQLKGTVYLRGSLPAEDEEAGITQFEMTCSAEYRIDTESAAVEIDKIELLSSTPSIKDD